MSDEAQALDAHSAADAFSSLLDGNEPNESETPVEDEATEAQAEEVADDTEQEEVTDEAPEALDLTIEVDGKQVKLTKEQIAENYKDGLRQADYTRKTMEAAEARKAAEAETAKAKAERTEYAQRVNNFVIAEQSGVDQIRAAMTQELLESDPVQYLTLQHTLHERQVKLAEAQRIIEQLDGQQKQEQAEENQNFLKHQRDALVDKLPELKDSTKLQAFMQKLDPYLTEQGFKPNDGRMLLDARFLMLAHKATQYDALMTKAQSAVKKIAPLPTKVERSGSPEVKTPDKRTTAMKQLERTGSISDAANAFANLF